MKLLGAFKVEAVLDELEQLKVQVKAYEGQLQGQEHRIGEVEEKANNQVLQQENQELKKRVDDLEEELYGDDGIVKRLKDAIETQNTEIEGLKRTVDEQDNKNAEQDVKIETIENTLRQYGIPAPEAKTKASNAAHSSSANNNHLDAAASNDHVAQETESSNSEAVSQNPSGLFGGAGPEASEEDEDKGADRDFRFE